MDEIRLKKEKARPNRLDFLRILNVRSPKLFAEHERLYNNLRAGEIGEQEVVRAFEQYGRKHWRYLKNYWAEVNGTFESDLIVFTRHRFYVLEIKNYTGVFEYNEGLSTIDGVDVNADCVFQARRSFKNIRKILSAQVGFQNVKGALVFAGQNNEVHIHSRVDDIQIVQRNQLMRFIQKIAEEEDAHRYEEINMKAVIAKLQQFQVANPFTFEPLSSEQMANVRPGIRCAHCGRFEVEITRKFVKCGCGCVELRDEAMVRTICEYGVLRFDEPLRIKELAEFFSEQASTRYLNDILATHFKMIKGGKNTYYENPWRLYLKNR